MYLWKIFASNYAPQEIRAFTFSDKAYQWDHNWNTFLWERETVGRELEEEGRKREGMERGRARKYVSLKLK